MDTRELARQLYLTRRYECRMRGLSTVPWEELDHTIMLAWVAIAERAVELIAPAVRETVEAEKQAVEAEKQDDDRGI